MTTRFPPPDPGAHWSDSLASEAGKRWSRQHRLRWGWLLLRRRWQGQPPSTDLLPGEGRCPGLNELTLDPGESTRIRGAWLRHVAQARRRAIAEALKRQDEDRALQRQAWMERGTTPAELEQMRIERAAAERRDRIVDAGLAIAGRLLPITGIREKGR